VDLRALAEAQRRTEQQVRELVEAQRRTEQQVQELVEAQRRTEQQVERLTADLRALAEAQRRTEQQVARLTADVRELTEAQRELERRVARLEDRVGDLQGRELERYYRDRAHAFFQRIVKAIRPADLVAVQAALDEGVRAGRITEEEKYDVLLADVLVVGRRDDQDTYLVVEVSAELREHDVERAAIRADLLRRATGTPALPVVAGRYFASKEAEAEAQARGVWRVLDGVTLPPGS
jgi:seryl-tRNA synthetase